SNAPSDTTDSARPNAPAVLPDLVFASTPYGWHHLRDLAGARGLVLALDPTEAELVALERDTPAFGDAGVAVAAVLRHRERPVSRELTRMTLTFTLLADPAGTIDEAALATVGSAGWLVLDADRRVCAAGSDGLGADGFVTRVEAAFASRAADTAP